MSRHRKPLLVGSQKTRDDLGRWNLLNDAGTAVSKYSIVRLSSTKEGGAYHKFKSAIADGTQEEAQLLVLWADSLDDTDLATASERYLLSDVDTSAATLGDLVYLSDSVAGAWTLTPTNEAIGRVTRVDASDGLIWIDPVWAKLAAVSTTSGTVKSIKKRVVLADLAGVGSTTGTLTVGVNVPAHTPFLGMLVYVTTAADMGGGGGHVDVTLGLGNAAATEGTQSPTSLNVTTATAGQYADGFTNASDYASGIFAYKGTTYPNYTITRHGGGNLSDLAAFDVTFVWVYADFQMAVP